MRAVAVLIAVVVAVAVAVVGPIGAVFGPDHWVCGAIGFGLSLPPAVATLLFVQWLARQSPYGALVGMAVGPPVRLAATLIPAGALFAAARHGNTQWAALADPLKFWLWVLAGYVVTLTVETTLAARAFPPRGRVRPGG